jgi:hypothetical protein
VVSFPQVSQQNPVHSSPLPIRATCPTHLILLDFITRTILGEQYRSLSSTLLYNTNKKDVIVRKLLEWGLTYVPR